MLQCDLSPNGGGEGTCWFQGPFLVISLHSYRRPFSNADLRNLPAHSSAPSILHQSVCLIHLYTCLVCGLLLLLLQLGLYLLSRQADLEFMTVLLSSFPWAGIPGVNHHTHLSLTVWGQNMVLKNKIRTEESILNRWCAYIFYYCWRCSVEPEPLHDLCETVPLHACELTRGRLNQKVVV